jgi:hypothetical protein
LLLVGSPAIAQTIWVGGGATGDWSQASNWTPSTPTSAATTSLLFATNNQINTNQNIANPFILNSLGFDTSAGAFVINSGALQFQANGATAPSIFTNTSAATTFNSPVTFSATGSIGGTGTGTGAIAFGSLTAGAGTLTVGHTGVTATSLTVQTGATIAPASSAASIGTLTVGTGGASISGTYAADIGAGTTSDLLAINGALTLGAASTLTISGTASGSNYTLATYTSHAGTFATVQNLPAGYFLSYGPTSLQLVPEPAMILAVCAAGAGVVGWRRRVYRSRRGVIA